MLERLLNKTDWQYAGIKVKDANPVLVQRDICTVAVLDGQGLLVVTVPEGPHPFDRNKGASAEHYIAKSDITGITYYNDLPAPVIQTPNGKKSGKMILTP